MFAALIKHESVFSVVKIGEATQITGSATDGDPERGDRPAGNPSKH